MEDTGRAFAFSRGTLERISRLSVIVSCIALFFMSLYIGVDVLVRKFFAVSIQGSDELSGYVLAFVSVWGFSYALMHKGHIRIEILYMKLSEKAQRFLDLVSMASLASFMWSFTYYGYRVLSTSISRNSLANTPLQTPLWIPQLLWFLGMLFFSLVILVYFLFPLVWFFRKRYGPIGELVGCSLLEENIREESGLEISAE